MQVRLEGLVSSFSALMLLLCVGARAQAPAAVTTTNGGAAGTVPIFTSNTNVENSVITQSNGNVGIDMAAPIAPVTIMNSGGSSVNDPPASLKGVYVSNTGYNNLNRLLYSDFDTNGGVGVSISSYFDLTNYQEILSLGTVGYGGVERTLNINTGNVGIGTTSPGATLEVNGNVKLTANSGAAITFQDGTTQTTAFIPANCGADYAESVGVSGDRAKYAPGDLLAIDPDHPGRFLKANQAYSTLVAGIYSTKPGFVGRLHPAADPASANEVPMAMVGRVPTKVNAENGPIKVGDLLVSSSTPGYAMKGTDRSRMLGAVIGKALAPLDSGTGVIEVLVTLQ